jgi:uncharacterized protein (TIRG00374 family)
VKRYRKHFLAALQAMISIAALAWLARQVDLSDSIASLASIPLIVVFGAFLVLGLGFAVSASRWTLCLENVGIELPWPTLFRYYMMGMFLSLFLPTSIGGDAFRVYAVGRGVKRLTAALFATVQERFLGLCGAVAASLAVMPLVGSVLPTPLLRSIVAFQLVAVLATVFVLYPSLLSRLWVPLARALSALRRTLPWMHSAQIAAHVDGVLARLGDLMRTRPRRVPILVALSLLPAVVISFAYELILRTIGVEVSLALLVMIVPLVWIVRVLPIAMGGIGIGEGAFVLLAVMAGMDREKAFAAALAVLAIQIAWSLIGGLLLVRSGIKHAFAYSQRLE